MISPDNAFVSSSQAFKLPKTRTQTGDSSIACMVLMFSPQQPFSFWFLAGSFAIVQLKTLKSFRLGAPLNFSLLFIATSALRMRSFSHAYFHGLPMLRYRCPAVTNFTLILPTSNGFGT